MSYFVLRSASQRTKSFTSFALAFLMVFQAIGPGLLAFPTVAQAAATDGTAHISATKIVCASESDLPDWATGQNNAPATITGNTATDFVTASNGHCHLQSGWQFQWGNETATDPGGAFIGAPSSALWHTFASATDVNGIANADVSINSTTDSKIWVREVLQNGYIPFTYDPSHPVNDNHVSAEMYCGSDVKNYDNYDQIVSPQDAHTYNCVAFNVATNAPCIIPNTVADGDKINPIPGVSPELTLQQILNTAYPPANTINTNTQETGIQSWSIPAGTNSVTVSGKYIGGVSGNTQAFGYYFDGNLSTYVPMFKNSAGHAASAPVLNPGDAIPSTVINTTGHTSIGFVIDTQGSNTAKYGTEKSVNGGDDHAVVYANPTNAKGYVIAFEDLPLASADKDYQDLVVELNVDSCSQGGSQCVPTSGTVVSDNTATFTGDEGSGTASAVTTPVNPAWTANIPGATWIWSTPVVNAPTTNNNTETFTKTFTVIGTPTSASIDVAADNYYTVTVNGHQIASSTTDANFATAAHFDIPAADINTGSNTVVVLGENEAVDGSDPTGNPAGILFSLSWSSDCGGGNGGNPGTSQVHVEKYVDGAPASFSGVSTPSFPIHVELGNGSADVSLDSSDSYTYTSDPVTNHLNTITVHEKTVEADPGFGSITHATSDSCTPGDYYTDGYSSSDVDFATAATQPHVTDLGTFDGIAHDKYVIVYNKTCPTTAHVVVSKIICPTEAELPDQSGGADITATTASDFLVNHQDCHANTDWQFQWGNATTTDPGGAFIGPASANWSTPFSGSTDVPVSLAGGTIHMREVLQSGYIPFSAPEGGFPGSDVSAELYCSTDVLNYDNLDYITNPVAGQTYYCVAWNVPTVPATPMGTIEITKYECPADTTVVRSANGVGGTVPAGCNLESGATFGYVHGSQTDANSPYPELAGPFVEAGATSGAGVLSTSTPANGRYLIAETDGSGNQLAASDILGLYCEGDGDTSNNNDNQELTFVTANQTTHCVGYNKTTGGGGNPGETFDYATTTIMAADLATGFPDATANPTKWFMYNDTNDTIDSTLGTFVTGPDTAPLGTGSVVFTLGDSPLDRMNIATYQYSGTALSAIKALRFSSYSHGGSGGAGSTESPYLAFNVDFTGSSGSFQKRLVYVPSTNGAAPQDTWNANDAIQNGNALWVYSGATWPAPNAIPGTTPKTWNQILADYPSARLLPLGGWMGVRVGEPGPTGYTGDVDNFVIAIKTGTNTHTETYDFEPTAPTPKVLITSSGCGSNCNGFTGTGGGGSSGGGGGTPNFAISGNGGAGAPQVLGAFAAAPGLPDTGNGASSQTLMTVLALIAALIGVNLVGLRIVRKS